MPDSSSPSPGPSDPGLGSVDQAGLGRADRPRRWGLRGGVLVVGAVIVAVAATVTGLGVAGWRLSPISPGGPLVAVHPRVSGGGFNGNVAWANGGNGFVEAFGVAWSIKGDTYVYLSWNSPTHHNEAIAAVGQGQHNEVPNKRFNTFLNPSNIAVMVCNNSPKWHCGKEVKV